MSANPLTIVGGVLLLFVAPGFLLLSALFPGRRYFGPFHPVALPVLAIVISTAILIVVGNVLGFLPGGPNGMGWFQGNQTGAPILELTLAGICVVLFAVAVARGAFPLFGRQSEYNNPRERGEPEEVTTLRDLRLEEERLRKEAIRIRRRAHDSKDAGVKGALTEAASDLSRDRLEISRRAVDVERRAGERRYGTEALQSQPRWRIRGFRKDR